MTAAGRNGSQRPLKFIMFPLGWLLAHTGRLIEIGKVLRARGHEVVFAGDDPNHPRSKMGMARDAGFRLAYAREPNHPYAWDRFIRYGWTITAWDLLWHRRWAPLDEILEGQVRLLLDERPDMIVGDGTISVSTAAYICGIPAAGVMNAYAARFVSPTSIFMPMIKVWDTLHLSGIRRPIYRKYGRKPVNALRLLNAVPLISPDLEGFYDTPKGWPQWHMVGPIINEPDVPLPDWYAELGDGRPNVYVTMGSTGMLDTFLRRSFGWLAKMPYRFLVTTAGQVSDEVLAMAPRNFRIATYAPGSKLLERSQALIFHGGNGTMYQGLAAGVPMIALPCHLEQDICAEIVVKRRVGLAFKPWRVTGRRLTEALNRIIEEPAFRENAQRYSAEVRNANGAERAADILETAAREGKPAGADLH